MDSNARFLLEHKGDRIFVEFELSNGGVISHEGFIKAVSITRLFLELASSGKLYGIPLKKIRKLRLLT